MNAPVDMQPIAAAVAPMESGAITIHEMSAADIPRWEQFVTDCPEASFFHKAGWKQVIEKSFGHRTWFLYAQQNGKIVGILALAQINSRLFGNSLSSLPFCVTGGIAATDEGARQLLDLQAQRLAASLKVDHLEYRNCAPQHPQWPTKDLYVTFRKPISADDEANMNAIPRKQRAMVRKGIKAGLESTLDDNVDRLFEAYASSVHRLGTPVFPKKYFALLQQVFGDACDVLTITHQGKTVASVLSFYFRGEVMPYYGGGMPAARELAGNDFMYWELMRRAAARGMRSFDFGRSKRGTGAFDFKKNWGFEPTPLYYEYQLHQARAMPDNNPLNPKFQLFIKLWKKLPLPVANLVGPVIVKQLG